MLDVLKSLATSATVRRFLVMALTAAAALLHRKFGVEVSPETIEWVVALAIAYITGSNLKEALVAQAQAKAGALPAPSLEGAAAELRKPVAR